MKILKIVEKKDAPAVSSICDYCIEPCKATHPRASCPLFKRDKPEAQTMHLDGLADEALLWLRKRTTDRERRNVEGTHKWFVF